MRLAALLILLASACSNCSCAIEEDHSLPACTDLGADPSIIGRWHGPCNSGGFCVWEQNECCVPPRQQANQDERCSGYAQAR